MDWYTVAAVLAAIYIPSLVVVWWCLHTAQPYPYDEETF